MPLQTIACPASDADFPLSRRLTPGLEVVPSIDSTNAELVRRERAARQPHFTTLVTLQQTAGKGRLDRVWSAAPDTSVAISVVIRPGIPSEKWGLLTLLGGLAAWTTVIEQLPDAPVTLKWPNDVLVGGRKIAGVLAQLVPETGAVVLGVGINTAMTEAELPVPTATSILIERASEDERGARQIADGVVAAFLSALAGLVARFELAGGDIDQARLRDELEHACATIGTLVRVELPDGTDYRGQAIGIGADGALLIVSEDGEQPSAILAGDVTHVRTA